MVGAAAPEGLPCSSIIDTEELYEILQRNTHVRNGHSTVEKKDVIDDMKRPGSLGLMRDHSEHVPLLIFKPMKASTKPVRQIGPESDLDAEHLKDDYLKIRGELFENDQGKFDEVTKALSTSTALAVDAVPNSAALAVDSVPPASKTRSRCNSATAARPTRPPGGETWLSSLRSGGASPPASTRGMKKMGSTQSLRQVGSAAALSNRQHYGSPPLGSPPIDVSAEGGPRPPDSEATQRPTQTQTQLARSPSWVPSMASGLPARLDAAAATTASNVTLSKGGELTLTQSARARNVDAYEASRSRQAPIDVEKELEKPRNLAAKAAWLKDLAEAPPKLEADGVPTPRRATSPRSPPIPSPDLEEMKERAARGEIGSGVDGDQSSRWTLAQQQRLNELDDRVWFSNILDRFEAFNAVRASGGRAPSSWDTSAKYLAESLRYDDLSDEEEPSPPARRPWGSPPPPPDAVDGAGHVSPGVSQRRAAEISPERRTYAAPKGKRRPS